MVETPPHIGNDIIGKALTLMTRPDVRSLIDEINDNYQYWSDVKYKRLPDGISKEELWAAVKLSRQTQRTLTWSKYGLSVYVTSRMQRYCHSFDMSFVGSWASNAVIPPEDKERYLVSSLMEEAISSSQMEGASTTRRVAKDMLRKGLSPRGRSEQMIVNNYASIRFITEHKDENLTPDLLLKIHSTMTQKTLEGRDDEGRFRTNDDVVVEDSVTHEVVHTPPSHTEINEFVTTLCDFVNTDSETTFIHPVIKATIVHFMIAYMHPFVDGNGRTARALFYWYMLKKGYWMTEYLAISRIIYKSKASYEKSYLYAEADGGDMGYFVAYHLRVLDLAFKELKAYIEKKIAEKQSNVDIMRLGGINERQMAILSMLKSNPKAILTVKEVENRFAVSYPTAKSDMDSLVQRGFLDKIPINKVKFNYVRSENFEGLIKP